MRDFRFVVVALDIAHGLQRPFGSQLPLGQGCLQQQTGLWHG